MPDAIPVAAPIQAPAVPAPAGAAAPAEKSWEDIKREVGAEDKGGPKADAKPVDKTKKPGEPETPAEKSAKAKDWELYQQKRKAVAKREEAVIQKEREGKQSVEALNKRNSELDQRAKHLDSLETDPKAFVEHFAKRMNMTPTKIVNALNEYFLENKTPTDIKLAKFEQDQKERDERAANEKKTAAEKAASEAREAKVNGYKSTIAKYVVENADKYDFLPTYPPEAVAAAAWARIDAHFDKTGQNIPLDKVLATLESEEEAQFLQKEERRKRRLGVAESTQTPPARSGSAGQPAADEAQRPTTLNHRQAGQRSPQARGASDRDDWEESKRQAGVVR